MYSVNFDTLRDDNLPFIMRTPILQQLISVLQGEAVAAHRRFTEFRRVTEIRLAHNGQVYLLRKILNDTFDQFGGRITIIDAVIPDDRYISNRGNLHQSYLATNAEVTNQFYIGQPPAYFGEYDFIVTCPIHLQKKTILIRQMVDTYKQAGKTYTLKFDEQ